MNKNILRAAIPLLVIYLLNTLFFSWLAGIRLVAGDEGFYLIAAKLIVEGKTPYLDFFYPQMPLLPYLYALFFKVFGTDLLVARLLTAQLTALLITLVFAHLKNLLNLPSAILLSLLLTFSNFALANFTVVQTYALSSLLLLVSFLFFQNKHYYCSAFFLGLTIQSRLIMAIVGLAFAGSLLVSLYKKEIDYTVIIKFGLVLLISLTPSLYLMAIHFDNFWFNNLGYHSLRNTLNPLETSTNKFTVLKVIFGLKETIKFSAWQLPLLCYLAILTAIIKLTTTRKISLAFLIAMLLLVAHLIPAPTYVQYFVALLPYLVITTAEGLKMINFPKPRYVLIVLLLLVYSYKYSEDLTRYTKTGQGVIGVMNQVNAKHWAPKHVRSIMNTAKSYCNQQKTTLAWSYWSGYLLTSNCQILPGTENHFSYLVADKLPLERRTNYHLKSLHTVQKNIKAQNLDLIISAAQDQKRHQLNLNANYTKNMHYFYTKTIPRDQ